MKSPPLVWVVTPVYNGERYLARCIESVLAQTYDTWTYLIVDNQSTDGTPEIARSYANEHLRITTMRNEEFLPIMSNWNRALNALSSDAKYCKVVHADDELFPHCLERMVSVAERFPRVGLVTSYAKWGTEIRHTKGVPYPSEVIDGHEICRATMEGECFVFGSPSSLLMRADLVRDRSSFYNVENVHADTEACFDILRDTDLGFVHEVLTYTRIHDEALTPKSLRMNTFASGWLIILLNHGGYYLKRSAYTRCLRLAIWRYVFFIAKATVRGRFLNSEFRGLHRAAARLLLRAISRLVRLRRAKKDR